MDSRRLEIRLPGDHPIFAVPAGQRGIIAKEWLDVGKRLNQIEVRLAEQAGQTGSMLTEIIAKLGSLAREISEIKSKQVVVSHKDQGLAIIIEDSQSKDIASDDFKIPTEMINAFDNWGANNGSK